MPRPFLKPILAACVLAVPLAHAADVHPAGADAAASGGVDAEFARPHQLVDVGGRRLNLYCSGSGPATVVFDAPGGEGAWTWRAVQPRVAARTRACVFDRAGMGFSDPSPHAATSAHAVEDLHALLGKAGIAPPYVLVGNSFGGANVQLYTYRYPGEVKALVLVEAGHEDETARLSAASHGKLDEVYRMVEQRNAQCLAAAQQGFDYGSDLFTACTGGTGAVYGRALAAARLAVVARPAYWRTAKSEFDAGETSDAELRAARRSFGDLPLVVLTRGVSPYAVPGRPQSALNKAFEDENLAIQKEMAALSTRSSQHIVAGASHVIQDTRPDAVADGVFEALDRAGY